MTTIDFKALTPEQRAELLRNIPADELKAAARENESNKNDNRKAYKDTVNETVPLIIKSLLSVSDILQNTKLEVFQGCKTLLDFKSDAYAIKQGQQSHSWSDDKGNGVTYGFRIIDDWDDTVTAGESIVKEVLDSLINDENSAMLVKTVNKLLKKDAKGNLKASRVLELRQIAEEFKNERLIDGVDIIQKAYKPSRSSWFIEAWTTDAQGLKRSIPLSITTVDFPEGTVIENLFPIEKPEENVSE